MNAEMKKLIIILHLIFIVPQLLNTETQKYILCGECIVEWWISFTHREK